MFLSVLQACKDMFSMVKYPITIIVPRSRMSNNKFLLLFFYCHFLSSRQSQSGKGHSIGSSLGRIYLLSVNKILHVFMKYLESSDKLIACVCIFRNLHSHACEQNNISAQTYNWNLNLILLLFSQFIDKLSRWVWTLNSFKSIHSES
jgi:hypothetical protein